MRLPIDHLIHAIDPKSAFELLRFGVVGVVVTLLYGALTITFMLAGAHPVMASVIAYLICAVAGYFGHRIVSFRSKAPPSAEIRKFAIINLASLAVSTMLVWLIADIAGLPFLGTAIVMIVIPILNFLFAKFYIFAVQPDPAEEDSSVL